MERRIGFAGIIVRDRLRQAEKVNRVLSEHGEIIIGRMGIPYREKNLSVITLIIDATTDELGALTGRLGKIEGVSVKSGLSKDG